MDPSPRFAPTKHYLTAIFAILILSLIVVTAFPTKARTQSVAEIAVARYLSAQADSALTDEEKIKTAIEAYFTSRYE